METVLLVLTWSTSGEIRQRTLWATAQAREGWDQAQPYHVVCNLGIWPWFKRKEDKADLLPAAFSAVEGDPCPLLSLLSIQIRGENNLRSIDSNSKYCNNYLQIPRTSIIFWLIFKISFFPRKIKRLLSFEGRQFWNEYVTSTMAGNSQDIYIYLNISFLIMYIPQMMFWS